MYLRLFNKRRTQHTRSQTNSRRIATPVPGFSSGKVPCGPDHALRDRGGVVHTFYLCVSRTEALLMASNTSYHERLHGLHRFFNRILALFAACKRSAVLAHGSEREGSALLCFSYSRSDLLR